MRISISIFVIFLQGASISAQDLAAPLTVLLEGTGTFEAAPHRQGNVYAPSVLIDNGRYKMWYGGQGQDGHDRISYAESDDGRHWIRKGVVLSDDRANHVNDPSVIKVDNRYFLYFTHTEIDVVDRIDVATSSDGLTWTSQGAVLNPSQNGDWDSLSVGRPSVIFENGIFKLWYDGRKDFPLNAPVKNVPKSDVSQRFVGYATSVDGLIWQRYEKNPVFGHDAGAVDVQRFGNDYVMLYESGAGTILAISSDGIQWTDRGIFLPKSTSVIDAFGHVTPFLLVGSKTSDNQIFFGAASAATWDRNRIAVATVPNARFTAAIKVGQIGTR